ncbi:MAG: hypothetical protein LBQ58_06000 [Synergistaceae bacterium]|jgi:uncharacterized Zn finger protein|nr:hypothetical protein [Synergistaceae bacterium]
MGKKKELKTILEKKNAAELVEMFLQASELYPEIGRFIRENEALVSGKIDALVKSLLNEIIWTTSQPAWSNNWNDKCNLPDYSHLKESFKALLKEGYCDELLELGAKLWQCGTEQIENSHDDGETQSDISECIAIVVSALPGSSLLPHEQLIWYIDNKMDDEYDLLYGCDGLLDSDKYGSQEWAMLAEELYGRIESSKTVKNDRFMLDKLVHWIVEAYQRANLEERVIPLLEETAAAAMLYKPLTYALLEKGERERAREWAILGYKKAVGNSRSVASDMREILHKMAGEDGRFDLAASYSADDFLDSPSVKTYEVLCKDSEKAGCLEAVREAALSYLETGKFVLRSTGKAPQLEPTEIAVFKEKSGNSRNNTWPDILTLIDIAIMEQRADDIVELYRRYQKTWRKPMLYSSYYYFNDKRNKVADAISRTHSEVSLEIWKSIVDEYIALVKPDAYRSAKPYLQKIHRLLLDENRLNEWRDMIANLRAVHKAKKRLMEVLNELN